MRDHRRLKAFQLADALALRVYEAVRGFPKEETFALALQLRRGAVSVVSNIVEGAARRTAPEYIHFLSVAYGSAREIEYQLSLAQRLGYRFDAGVEKEAGEVCQVLRALIHSQRPED